MSRHITNAGAFYAYVSNGLGRPLGVAAAWVAGKLVPDFFGPRLGAWAKLLLQSVVGIVVSFGVLMALKVEELQPATSRFTRLIKRR
jgi:putative peptidoglycan lipid II flippase